MVKSLVIQGKLKKKRRTLQRLRTIESFNESASIKEAKIHAFKVTPWFVNNTYKSAQEGSALAAAAEKIHQTQMEIIRLKYPVSLARSEQPL